MLRLLDPGVQAIGHVAEEFGKGSEESQRAPAGSGVDPS